LAGARRGQSLVEFALVSLVVYLMLAAILTFGHLLFVSQGVQQAADLAAREISRSPLPADDFSLTEVLQENANTNADLAEFRDQIYDEHYLVLNLDTLHGYASLEALISQLPLVNQQLTSLMIRDEVGGITVLRYPGAVLVDSSTGDDPTEPSPSGYLVQIPLVTYDGAGAEIINLVPVVEPTSVAADGAFQLSSADRGVVALRINYPYQSASMSNFLHDESHPDYPYEPTIGRPIEADEDVGIERGIHAGEHGLGVQQAFGKRVRPFRKVVSAQAVYRRELFQ